MNTATIRTPTFYIIAHINASHAHTHIQATNVIIVNSDERRNTEVGGGGKQGRGTKERG